MRFWQCRTAAAFLLALLLTGSTVAADFTGNPAGPPPDTDLAALRSALVERAVLYELRSAFNVLDFATIADLLRADAKRLAASSYADAEQTYVEEDLLAEGSYYIVSLTYLASVGGANWPIDRQAEMYQRDAEVRLDALKRSWIAAVESGQGDIVAIMTDVDTINAWSEGAPKLTPELSHFARTYNLVDDALRSLASGT